MLVNLGERRGEAAEGLLTTAAAVEPARAAGSRRRAPCSSAGRPLQWLGQAGSDRHGLSERLAESVESTDGVHFVPALTGLGSPQWRPDARPDLWARAGRTAYLVRAALEAVAHQVADVLDALPLEVDVLRADGEVRPPTSS